MCVCKCHLLYRFNYSKAFVSSSRWKDNDRPKYEERDRTKRMRRQVDLNERERECKMEIDSKSEQKGEFEWKLMSSALSTSIYRIIRLSMRFCFINIIINDQIRFIRIHILYITYYKSIVSYEHFKIVWYRVCMSTHIFY